MSSKSKQEMFIANKQKSSELYIISAFLYGGECWTLLSVQRKKRVEAIGNVVLRNAID